MDIRKLQRVIVDGLEDVKAQNIVVFNTEHLSSLFERVIIASGTSNRQTKSLASSVREAVKDAGFPVPRTEGETNGEWIIVDCGAAVVHVMQPTIRDFYHLEEIWGDKPVRMKIDGSTPKLVKAEEPAPPARAAAAKTTRPRGRRGAEVDEATFAPERPVPPKAARGRSSASETASAKPASKSTAPKPTAPKPPATKVVAKKAARKAVVMPGAAAKKAPARKVAPQKLVTRVVGLKKPTPKRGASPVAAKKSPSRRAPAKKAASRA